MSGRKFSVGDRVRIVRSPVPSRIGTIATVISPLKPLSGNAYWTELPNSALVHELDLPPLPSQPRAHVVTYPPEYLEPIYDGNETVSWSSCVWKPKQVRA